MTNPAGKLRKLLSNGLAGPAKLVMVMKLPEVSLSADVSPSLSLLLRFLSKLFQIQFERYRILLQLPVF